MLKGVNPILPTPFTETGEVDTASLIKLMNFQKQVGVNGVAILGFMGEAHKLSEAERDTVVKTVIQHASDLDVWVGVRALGTAGSIEQAQKAEKQGASAVFVAPIAPQTDAALYEHYKSVAEAISIPVIIHDFPESFGITISAEVIAKLAIDGYTPYIKLEEQPALDKLSKILKLSDNKIKAFGGLGGKYFLEELERGAAGIMTGLAFPEILVKIYEQFSSGQTDAAAATFDNYASFIRYEFQPKIGLAYRKYIFLKRGIFSSNFIRKPGMQLDDYTISELERVLARAGLDLSPGVKSV